MGGNTIYLNGLDELNCCLENSNNAAIPVQGLGNAFGMANNINYLASKGGITAPLKQALTKEISKAADKIIGKTPVMPQVNPSLVNPNQPKPAVVTNAVTDFKKAVIEQKNSCKANCAPPVRTMPSVAVKVSAQTGKSDKKQLRKFNAAELNVMTRVIVEPMRKSLEATLVSLNQFPAQNAVYYNVPVYKSFITELLQNWSNPVALKAIFPKYEGKINNNPVMNKLAMLSGLTGGYNGLGGMFDFVRDIGNGIKEGFSNAAKWAANMGSNAYDSLKNGVDVTFEMINKAGAAIGEGIKNAAVWSVGMLQKYNPAMIIARQAFRGLLAINFRGWASDMQGMRDRGQENKIKDTWTGTFVGGNWGDLVSAINTGAGRDKNKATDTSTTELTPETIDTIEPFDWVGGQKDGLGFHTVAKHTLKAGDEININVLVGDKAYNGVHKVKYVGDDEGKNKDTFFVLNILKKGGASGTFQFANEFDKLNDLWRVGIDPNRFIQKAVIDKRAGDEPVKAIIPVLPNFNPIALPDAPKLVVPVNNFKPVTPTKPAQTISIVNNNGNPVTIKRDLAPVITPTSSVMPSVKPVVTDNVLPVTNIIKKNTFASIAAKAKGLKGLGALGEPVTAASMIAAATPIIKTITDLITKANEVVKTVEDGKKLITPFLPSNSGGGSGVPSGIDPNLPSPPNPANNNPQPATPSNPSGSNNANNGGGSNKMLLIGSAIAAVVLVAILSNSNAKPAKQLSGLDAAKKTTTAKPKTVKTFKI